MLNDEWAGPAPLACECVYHVSERVRSMSPVYTFLPCECVYHVSEQAFTMSPIYSPRLAIVANGLDCRVNSLPHKHKLTKLLRRVKLRFIGHRWRPCEIASCFAGTDLPE